MPIDPSQEDVFQENDFVPVHYRSDLLPLWMKVLACIGALSGAMLTILLIVLVCQGNGDPKSPSLSAMVIAALFFGSFAVTSMIAFIQLIREKKWAIYGSLGGVLSHMALFGGGMFFVNPFSIPISEAWPLLIFYAVMFISQLAFLIKLMLIFKRWLIYTPSLKLENRFRRF